MPKMKQNKGMKRGNHQINYCNDIAYIKRMDTKSLMLFRSNIDVIESKSKVIRRQKGFATEISVPKKSRSITHIWVILT